MPKHLTEKDLVISTMEPINPKNDCIWINSDSGLIQVFMNKRWNTLGYYNKAEIDSKIADLNVSLNKLYDAKVDKVPGKVLSSNNFTNTLKTKLDSISEGANLYTHPTGDGNLHMTEAQKERWTNNDDDITRLSENKADDIKLENNVLSLYANGRKTSSVEIPYLSEITNIHTRLEEFKREFIEQTFTSYGFGSNLDCNSTLEGVAKSIIIRGTEDVEHERNVYMIKCTNKRDELRSENIYSCELILNKSLRKRGNDYDSVELVNDKYCVIYRVGKETPEIEELSSDIDLALKNIKTFNNYTKIVVTSLYSSAEIKVFVANTLISNVMNLFVNIQGIDEQMSLLEFAALTMSLNLKDIEKEIDKMVGGNSDE